MFTDLNGDIRPLEALMKRLSEAGVSVFVHPGSASPHSGNGLEVAAADIFHGRADVYHPLVCEAHQVYHELLHLELTYIRGSTCLVAASGANASAQHILSVLNNDFEHAFVIPEEIRVYGDQASSYWKRGFIQGLEEIERTPSDAETGLPHQRLKLLQGWLTLPHVSSLEVVANGYREKLRERGWLGSAEAMTHAVQRAGSDKRKAVAAFREALGVGYPEDNACSYILLSLP